MNIMPLTYWSLILCLTKLMCTKMNNKAFTIVELMLAVGFSVLLLTGVYGFYTAASQVYSSGIAGQSLQDGANIILSKIIEGQSESGTVYRLSTSETYGIPNSNIIYFCQDNPLIPPCGTSDSTVRWYTLDPTSTSLRYYHPTSNPLGYDVIYTAPKNTTITLRFSPAQEPNPLPPPTTITIPNVIEIDVALTENLLPNVTNNRLAASGSASTFVLLRDHP